METIIFSNGNSRTAIDVLSTKRTYVAQSFVLEKRTSDAFCIIKAISIMRSEKYDWKREGKPTISL